MVAQMYPSGPFVKVWRPFLVAEKPVAGGRGTGFVHSTVPAAGSNP
jgi:hypothetical protein